MQFFLVLTLESIILPTFLKHFFTTQPLLLNTSASLYSSNFCFHQICKFLLPLLVIFSDRFLRLYYKCQIGRRRKINALRCHLYLYNCSTSTELLTRLGCFNNSVEVLSHIGTFSFSVLSLLKQRVNSQSLRKTHCRDVSVRPIVSQIKIKITYIYVTYYNQQVKTASFFGGWFTSFRVYSVRRNQYRNFGIR